MSVGQSTAAIYAPWRSYATVIGVMVVVLCGISVTFAFYLAREMRRRSKAEMELEALAATDGLTGLSNRRDFNAAIEREWRRAIRAQSALAMLMIDADQFKVYNDRYGHLAGDRLLQALGAAMTLSSQRGIDVAARYGGDEFAILLPGSSTAGAAKIADQVRTRFAEVCGDCGIVASGLSMGVASIEPCRQQPVGDLIAAADRALYSAKKLGRNRTEAALLDRPVAAAAAAA